MGRLTRADREEARVKMNDFLKSMLLLGAARDGIRKGTAPKKVRDKEREAAAEAKRQRKALKRLKGRK